MFYLFDFHGTLSGNSDATDADTRRLLEALLAVGHQVTVWSSNPGEVTPTWQRFLAARDIPLLDKADTIDTNRQIVAGAVVADDDYMILHVAGRLGASRVVHARDIMTLMPQAEPRENPPRSNWRVVYVDGTRVRNEIDPDFAHAGHWLVFDFIPEGEIWIDKFVPYSERNATIEHEVVEIGDMLDGANYDEAHKKALVAEAEVRRQGNVALGDCFRWAGHKVREFDELARPMLVHGLVRCDDGEYRWHAWIDVEGKIFDVNQPDGVDRYRWLKYAQPSNTERYTALDSLHELLRHGHWGPWVRGDNRRRSTITAQNTR